MVSNSHFLKWIWFNRNNLSSCKTLPPDNVSDKTSAHHWFEAFPGKKIFFFNKGIFFRWGTEPSKRELTIYIYLYSNVYIYIVYVYIYIYINIGIYLNICLMSLWIYTLYTLRMKKKKQRAYFKELISRSLKKIFNKRNFVYFALSEWKKKS